MSGSSGDFFDFNHDGKLDALEWSAKMEFWDEVSKDHSSDYAGTGRVSRKSKTSSGRTVNKASGVSARSGAGQKGSTVAGQKGSTIAGQKGNTIAAQKGSTDAGQKEKAKLDPTEKILLKIFLAVVCVIVGYYVFKGIRHERDRNAELRRIEHILEAYKDQLPEELPKYCKKRGISFNGSYTAKCFPEMTMSPGSGKKYQFYNVTLDYEVTLHADQYFDKMDDRAKYDYLGALYEMTGKAYDAFMRKSFPEIAAPDGMTSVEGLSVSNRGAEYEVYIETPAHVYQYSKMYDDLFILDGKSYFLEDELSRWK